MIFVAIGANLRDAQGVSPARSCVAAMEWLAAQPDLAVVKTSRWYDTAAQPDATQPRYVNGVVALRGGLPPGALLARLQAYEHEAGRVRSERNAPRVLDLDLIDVNGIVRDTSDPLLPHPRLHLRAFVLLPLRDVAPGWIHPRLGLSVDELIAVLPPQDTRLMADPLSL